jgi:hypothetical protein
MLRPIFAPKQRSKNRLQAKHGLGLYRKSGCASVHSMRRVISADEYFLARRFRLTSSILVSDIRDRKSDVSYYYSSIKNDRDFFSIHPGIRPIFAEGGQRLMLVELTVHC